MAGHYGVVTFNLSLPDKCSPWSQDRLQFIVFALLFSPSYIVVTQSIVCTIYGAHSNQDLLGFVEKGGYILLCCSQVLITMVPPYSTTYKVLRIHINNMYVYLVYISSQMKCKVYVYRTNEADPSRRFHISFFYNY